MRRILPLLLGTGFPTMVWALDGVCIVLIKRFFEGIDCRDLYLILYIVRSTDGEPQCSVVHLCPSPSIRNII